MRILFLTNFYPPYELGGQGRSCQQVVQGLQARGHETLVLTSRHGVGETAVIEPDVHRSLFLEMELSPWRHALVFFTSRKYRENHNHLLLKNVLQKFDPDVVFVWGMWNLDRSLAATAEAYCPRRVAYRFAEYWPTLPSQHKMYWEAPGRNIVARWLKQLLGRIAMRILEREEEPPQLAFAHVMCVSEATKNVLLDAGIAVNHAQVIHTGLDVSQYLNDQRDIKSGNDKQRLKLLYAGRLSPDKGVETAIQAIAWLRHQHGLSNIHLGLAGAGAFEYEQHLRNLIAEAQLDDVVTLLGRIPPEEMPALYKQYDVLIVPSIWPEPFARVVLEGMAASLVVVATPSGGTAEIVHEGENGLLFAPGNAADLGEKIAKLTLDSELGWRLAQNGHKTVQENFTVTRMLDGIEAFLKQAAKK
ncbi:MAG: glycosyltransferase family 4 protein [Anaerolineaceae bacterium]|nr:glycosyltransferase family 4 protein [Anaerolineaceae bacterium]